MSFLKHYGTPRHSGRYPWGSGDSPEQRHKSFLGYVEKLKTEGLSEVEIASGMGMTTTQLRTRKSIAKAEIRAAMVTQAQKLKTKGLSNVAIAERMNLNESSVRALLNPALQDRANIAVATANTLRKAVDEKGMIDIGLGVEAHLGISRTKLNTAVSLLEEEGYTVVNNLQVQQIGTGKYTSLKVLAPPGTDYKTVFKNRADIKTITDYSTDGGRSFLGLEPIQSVSRSRIKVRHDEEGGSDKDGVIELRRGVDDISLGKSKYAQVRIGVNGNMFMKGMAIYSDDMPPGVDIIYNTNKKKGAPDSKIFKPMESDPDNPFGSVVRQQHYLDKNGQKKLSALNIVNEEGDWSDWSRSISSQVLSKQSPALAKKQLDIAKNLKQEELDEILSLTNPVVKKRLLESFADDADSAAVHLKAAALPRQANKVILPIPSMKPNEVYAPSFNDGESVVLIRHPHGGIFEIPEVRVNNRNPAARSIMQNAKDAIGIHPDVAKKLSGADFDGDTVLVIPNKNRDIKTAPSLKGLADFDPKVAYKLPDDAPKMSNRTKQMQMGDVSNLITDMTIKGATANEIARAVRHSMVVIDAEKHHLDYKRSAVDNGIAQLKEKYQGGARSGASTLVSRASSEKRVPFREEGKKVTDPITGKTKRIYIDPNTGEKLFEQTGETFTNAKGKVVPKTTVSTKMAEVSDAFELSSGTKIEGIYAEHANALKAMANTARKEMVHTPNLVYSPTAKQTYAPQVATLKAKLREAIRNKPQERQAQLLANSIVAMKKAANPNMDASDLKKIKGQALEEARSRTGAKKVKIEITDKEWEAIQLGAISNNTLSQIVANTDMDVLKNRATPRTAYVMTPAKVAKAQALAASGHTPAEIASALGVSASSIQNVIE